MTIFLRQENIMIEKKPLSLLGEALCTLEEGLSQLGAFEDTADIASLTPVIEEVAEKMQDNYPYFHPLYAGQMIKPPHPVARIAYMLSMYINPNNHALDGGRASSHLEKEAVANIARMMGWEIHLGHLTSGGTFANLEALWVAGELHPGKKILASEMSHYTHERITGVLKIPFASVPCTADGGMDCEFLEKELAAGDTGTVVATLGTTGIGALDPLDRILPLCEKYNVRVHVDAAYGGFFKLASNLDEREENIFRIISGADSLVIDPHKHGLQPYGCGCVLFKDPSVGKFYAHNSPYTYFTSEELHLGEISLECSRAGASAVALWATQRLLPLEKNGEFARMLEKCRNAALDLYDKMTAHDDFMVLIRPQLDILVWAPAGKSLSEISAYSQELFDRAAENDLHLALFQYPSRLLNEDWQGVEKDTDEVTLVRMCLMKPEHESYAGEIWRIINECVKEILPE